MILIEPVVDRRIPVGSVVVDEYGPESGAGVEQSLAGQEVINRNLIKPGASVVTPCRSGGDKYDPS